VLPPNVCEVAQEHHNRIFRWIINARPILACRNRHFAPTAPPPFACRLIPISLHFISLLHQRLTQLIRNVSPLSYPYSILVHLRINTCSHHPPWAASVREHFPILSFPSSLPSSSILLPSLPQQTPTRLDTGPLPPPGSRLSSMTPSPILYPTMEARYTKQSPVFARVPSQQRYERSNHDAVVISMLLNMSRSSSQGDSSASSTDPPSPVECRKPYSITSTKADSGEVGKPYTVTTSSLLGIHQSAPVGKGKRQPEWQEATNRPKRAKVE